MTSNSKRKVRAFVIQKTRAQLGKKSLALVAPVETVAEVDVVVTKDGWLVKNRHGTAGRYVTAGERREFGL